MRLRKNIPFFILLVISSVSSVSAQVRWTFTTETAAAVLLAKESGFSGAPQFLPSAFFSVSASSGGGFGIGIGGGILGANDSPVMDGIRYRGFHGLTAGIDAEWFPPGPRQNAERGLGAEDTLPAVPSIGVFARVSGNQVRYDLTRQWFFYPSLRVGALIPIALPIPGTVSSGGAPSGGETLIVTPFAEWLMREDIPLSISIGTSIRMRFTIASLPGRESP